MKIFIDPGHGGIDVGAVNTALNLHEADINLKVGLYLNEILKNKGFETKMSRMTNEQVTLNGRAEMANEWGANYFISIHCNSSTIIEATGTETFCLKKNISAEKLAEHVQEALVKEIQTKDRGVSFANFAVLRLTYMPSILVELAFISNLKEATQLKNPVFQEKCAVGISNGLISYIDSLSN